MTQPAITLTDGTDTITLDPDLQWIDEFEWSEVEQSFERTIGGSAVIDEAIKTAGRSITLAAPADDAAWMLRSVLAQLRAWESQPGLRLTLDLRGTAFQVIFRRFDGAPIDAKPVDFVADPIPGGFGDWYLPTFRFLTVE